MITDFAGNSRGKTIELIPINCNKILFIGMNTDNYVYTLHLLIHKIRAYCIGPALWMYHHAYDSLSIFQFQPMKSTTNTLGITFRVDSESHMELFDVSTDTKEDGNPSVFVKSGQLNYGRQLNRPGLS